MNVTEARQRVKELRGEIKLLKPEITEINDLFTTYLALSRQMGLPPEMMSMLRRLQQLRVTAMMLIRTIHMLEIASGPWGWLMFLGTALTTGVAGMDLYLEAVTG